MTEKTGHRDLVEVLRALVAPVVSAQGLELVDVVLRGPTRRRLVRLDIDREGPQSVNLDDCQRVSQAVGTVLEESDALAGSFVLEVSSPGVDRPIRSEDDIRRNTGRRVVVVARDPAQGRRTFRGVLLGATPSSVRVAGGDGGDEVEIGLATIESMTQDIGF